MRLINKIVLVIMLITAGLTLSGCDNKEKPTVEIIEVLPFRQTASVTYKLTDNDEVIAKSSLIARIYEKGESSVIDSVSLDEDDYDEVEIDFDGLEVGTSYEVKFFATYNEKSRMIAKDTLKTSNIGGSVEEANEIKTYQELVIAGKDPSGHHILMNDIDCEGKEISPLFLSTSKKLTGGFDGNGKTISNFKITNNTAYVGLFGVVGNDGYVKNLNVSNATIDVSRSSSIYVGGLIGKNEGAISDVTVTDLSIVVEGTSTNNMHVGGLIGYNTESSSITNCVINGGKVENTAVLVNDETNDELELTDEDKEPVIGVIKIIAPGTAYVGGFIGANQADSTTPFVSSCSTDMDIEYILYNDYSSSSKEFEFKVNLGGFVGYNAGVIKDSEASTKITYISYIAKEEKIKSLSLRIGGFAGKNIVEINDCKIKSAINVECDYANNIYVGGYIGVHESYYNSDFTSTTKIEDITAVGNKEDSTVNFKVDYGFYKLI